MRGEVPGIMVSSTYYDLRELRQQLARFLQEEMGYRALISEFTDFPVDPDADAIENCRRRVEENADVLVLVIGSRYGFVERDSGRSVTNLEYLGARAKGIPIYAFIEKRTLTLFEAWRAAAGPARAALAETVDTSQFFDFIEQVRSSDSVWMNGFESAAEIVATLRVQFAYQMRAGLDVELALRKSTDRELLRGLSGRSFRFALDRPEAWEYKLFASVLLDEVEAALDVRREYDQGIVLGAGEYLTDDHFFTWVRLKFAEIIRMSRTAERLLNQSLQEAFRPAGVPGNVSEIVFVARQLGRVYREAMEWTRGVRRTHPESDDLQELIDTLAGYSGEIVEKLAGWASQLGADIERSLEEARRSPPGSVRREVRFTLVFEDNGADQFVEMVRAVYARRGTVLD
jgi:hypothetical protein